MFTPTQLNAPKFASQISYAPEGNQAAMEIDEKLAQQGIQKVPHFASPMAPIIFYYPATPDQVEPLTKAFKQALGLPSDAATLKYKKFTINVLWKPPASNP